MDPTIYFDAAAADYGRRSAAGLWGLVRELERESLFGLLAPREGERAIDAGCGAGFYGILLQERGCDVTAIDASEPMVRIARAAGLRALHARIEDAGLDAGQADAVVCAGALEFCETLAPVFSAFARWLRPGGRAVLLYPAGILAPGYRLYHRLHGVSVHLRCESEIASAAREAGFEVTRTQSAGPLARCMGLRR